MLEKNRVPRVRAESTAWRRLVPFAIWVSGSFLAIAFVGDRPYVGLAIALGAGIALGLSSVIADDLEQ